MQRKALTWPEQAVDRYTDIAAKMNKIWAYTCLSWPQYLEKSLTWPRAAFFSDWMDFSQTFSRNVN